MISPYVMFKPFLRMLSVRPHLESGRIEGLLHSFIGTIPGIKYLRWKLFWRQVLRICEEEVPSYYIKSMVDKIGIVDYSKEYKPKYFYWEVIKEKEEGDK